MLPLKPLPIALVAALGASVALAASAGDCPPASRSPWPTRDWQVSTPEAQGMDAAALARIVDFVGTYRQDSLLVVRHGQIVAEAAYAPFAPNIRHDLRSVTKSFIGTLAGIAVRKGLLDSVDNRIVDLFPEKKIANLDDLKRAITVQTMLDMTSGIQWKEHGYGPDEPIFQMYKAPDRAAFVLNQPMSDKPGARFLYDGGNPYVLSALITRKAGEDALDFARDELFKPLGISSVRWGEADAQGVTDGEAGLYLKPRDMAKLGYLYLHEGAWDGEEIIPSSWVERARTGPVTAHDGYHYGNLWWSLPDRDAYMALGRHSQEILVLPKLDVVAVITGYLGDDEAEFPTKRLIDDLGGAIRSDKDAPADPAAEALLAQSIERAATEKAIAVGPTPALAKTLSGKVYRFADNDFHLKSFTLNLADPVPSWEIATATQRLDRPLSRISGSIGLDGRYAKSPASYGVNAVRGAWLDDHTFKVEWRILGHSETRTWTLAFDREKVDLGYEDNEGNKSELHGEAGE